MKQVSYKKLWHTLIDRNLRKNDLLNATWRIVDIESRYMEFNAYYVDMIRAKMKPGMPTALCTHHVPHVRLNGHEPSHYSFYTGIPW